MACQAGLVGRVHPDHNRKHGHMTRDESLNELQRRIAERKGYKDVRWWYPPGGPRHDGARMLLQGVLHADEGPTVLPRWPWDWCDAGVLMGEMEAAESVHSATLDYSRYTAHECRIWGEGTTESYAGDGHTFAEAICRCWCAWRGVDLSDLPLVAP